MIAPPDLRASLRAALAAAMPELTWVRAWWRAAQPSDLPRGAVLTPRHAYERTSVGGVNVEADLIVMIKRAGGDDLDDLLDADAEAAMSVVLAYLDTISDDFDLVDVRSDVSDKGQVAVGEIGLNFRVLQRG